MRIALDLSLAFIHASRADRMYREDKLNGYHGSIYFLVFPMVYTQPLFTIPWAHGAFFTGVSSVGTFLITALLTLCSPSYGCFSSLTLLRSPEYSPLPRAKRMKNHQSHAFWVTVHVCERSSELERELKLPLGFLSGANIKSLSSAWLLCPSHGGNICICKKKCYVWREYTF